MIVSKKNLCVATLLAGLAIGCGKEKKDDKKDDKDKNKTEEPAPKKEEPKKLSAVLKRGTEWKLPVNDRTTDIFDVVPQNINWAIDTDTEFSVEERAEITAALEETELTTALEIESLSLKINDKVGLDERLTTSNCTLTIKYKTPGFNEGADLDEELQSKFTSTDLSEKLDVTLKYEISETGNIEFLNVDAEEGISLSLETFESDKISFEDEKEFNLEKIAKEESK